MLRNSNDFLKKCELLKAKEVFFPIKPGVQLARGFADLGYEEFLLLENNKLISLYRGTESLFSENEKHLFRVPTVDELRQKIYEMGFDFKNIKLDTKISFELIKNEKNFGEFTSTIFAYALMDSLISILNLES